MSVTSRKVISKRLPSKPPIRSFLLWRFTLTLLHLRCLNRLNHNFAYQVHVHQTIVQLPQSDLLNQHRKLTSLSQKNIAPIASQQKRY